jgi:hypothetical protein
MYYTLSKTSSDNYDQDSYWYLIPMIAVCHNAICFCFFNYILRLNFNHYSSERKISIQFSDSFYFTPGISIRIDNPYKKYNVYFSWIFFSIKIKLYKEK